MNDMHSAEIKTESFIRQNNLLPNGEKVLLAVSGGADSVALLYILNKLIPNVIHIAHINHQLRGDESLKDEEFVKSLAKKFNLPVTVESVNVKLYAKENKLSIETAARQLRLAALWQIANENKYNIIATAHHKNDNAETVIHRLMRGTGFRGLAGIRPKTVINCKTFVRPLLCLSRKEIEDYLKNQNISWQSDHTNLDCRFTRNRIRHKLMPYLQKNTPNLIELLGSLSKHCAILTNNLEKLSHAAEQVCFISKDDKQITIDLTKYLKQPPPVQVELIQKALALLECGLREYTFEHYRKIIDFVKSAQAGKTLTVPGKIKIAKRYDSFFVTTSQQKTLEEQIEIELKVPGKTVFKNYEIETEVLENFDIKNIRNKKDNLIEWFDYEQIKLPLIARLRRQGDKFKPFGQNEFKKVGKFFTSQKIDIELRNRVFLICDSQKILWLVPVRRCSQAPIKPQNRSILQIKII